MNDLVKSIKKASLDAVHTTNPVNIVFGKVISNNPISVSIDNKFTITEEHLILPKQFNNHIISAKVEGKEVELKINNKLNTDEKVILIRMQGGQKYLVLDRLDT